MITRQSQTDPNGRPGLIASVHSPQSPADGRQVLVLGPAAKARSDGLPAWRVLVLGRRVDLPGTDGREIVVPDDQLTPVSQLDADEAEVLAKSQARADLAQGLADLRLILEHRDVSQAELDAAVEMAARQALLQRALVPVPVEAALEDVGFLKDPDGLSSWDWFGVHGGIRLKVMAHQDQFGAWCLVGQARTPRTAMFEERTLGWHDGACLGEVAAAVLGMWREAFGRRAPAPAVLSVGRAYEEHQRDLRKVATGGPRLYLDGQVFRATRRWIVERWRHEPGTQVTLSQRDGLLALTVDSTTFGVPASGCWPNDYSIAVGELAALPPWRMRGRSISASIKAGQVTFGQV